MKSNIHSPALRGIKITDPFFEHYVSMVAEKIIPYQWDVLCGRIKNDKESYCIENFRIAAGEIKGEHRGVVFGDTDAYKWLQALSYCLEAGAGREFEQTADELIDLLGRAQEPDGYLNTYFTLSRPQERWTNLTEGHELYSAGHLIEAAVAYYNATGKRSFLDIAIKLADLICSVFLPDEGAHPGYPGHQEIELALVKLARVTGNERYLKLARHFLSVRGGEPNYLLAETEKRGGENLFPEFRDYDALYAQTHKPPREQRSADGHAVRAMYMYSAMADLAAQCGDEDFAEACSALWESVTQRRMYITGGIGSSGHLERFTTDYDLPNDRMYCESCASVGLMMFGQRMAALTGEAAYYDAVERALCNTVLAGISAEGDRYFYVNSLEAWPSNCLENTSLAHVKPVRQPWFATACCPTNIARTLASLGQYIYAQDDDSIYINQLISSTLKTSIGGSAISLRLDSSLMTNSMTRLSVSVAEGGKVNVRLRIPSYIDVSLITLDGAETEPKKEKGYAVFELSGGEHRITLSGRVAPRFVAANSEVRADEGRVALMYGPYVYCLEETDNGKNLQGLYVSCDAVVDVRSGDAALPGSLPALCFDGLRLKSKTGGALYAPADFSLSPERLKAVPYALWCNRTPGEMLVWLKALFRS